MRGDGGMAVDVEILDHGGRSAAGAIWRELEPRAGCGPTYGWDWTEAWLEHFGDVVPHLFAVGRDGAGPVGVALVTFDAWRRGPLRLRRAHLGTAGEPAGESVYVERNGLLALPDRVGDFADALTRALGRARRWDGLVLDGFLADHADAFAGQLGGRWEISPQTALIADLSSIADGGPAAPFSAGVRREWRRAERRLGPFDVEWAEEPARAVEILDELIVLHQERWEAAGRPGAFESTRVRAFHRDVVRRLAADGGVALTRVSAPHGLLGCRYDLVDGERLISYQCGWLPGPDEGVSVGVVLDLACMDAAQRRGLRIWDHLAGPQRHKRRLSTGSYDLQWCTGRRGWARWHAFDTARALRRLARAGADTAPRNQAPPPAADGGSAAGPAMATDGGRER